MKKLWTWIRNNPNRAMFLLPIILVAGISISHVVSWYDMANPISWAIYLSIAIEIGAITALVAATNKIKGGIWFMFGLVTFIQMIGNVFYCYKEIDPNGDLFKSWVELTGPVWELMGTEVTDTIGMKRWLAFLEGGLLPIISLTSLHFFVKYEKQSYQVYAVVGIRCILDLDSLDFHRSACRIPSVRFHSTSIDSSGIRGCSICCKPGQCSREIPRTTEALQ